MDSKARKAAGAPIPIPDAIPSPDAIPGLDAVRAAAALGVVLLHCCVPYMQPEVPGLVWSVRDTPHWLASQCFWAIELFIMPVFLVLAGFLAWQSLQRSGPSRLIQTRARRLLIPLAFGMIVVLPLDLYAWLLGWVSEGVIPWKKLRSLKFDHGIDKDLWGLSHLWFLQYLFLYVLTLAACVWGWRRVWPAGRHVPAVQRLSAQHLSASRLSAGLLAVGCLTLVWSPEVVWGFQHRFYPVLSKWIYSGAFFACGVLLASLDPQLSWLKMRARGFVGPAVVFAGAALVLGQWHLRGGENQLASIMLAITTCVSASLITLGLIGLAAKHVKRLPLSVSYLAAASFWIYMVHHPLLGLIHTDLKWWFPNANPLMKLAAAFVVASTVSIATYEVWVRRSALGRLLGFQWQMPERAQSAGDGPREILPMDPRREQTSVPATTPTRRAA